MEMKREKSHHATPNKSLVLNGYVPVTALLCRWWAGQRAVYSGRSSLFPSSIPKRKLRVGPEADLSVFPSAPPPARAPVRGRKRAHKKKAHRQHAEKNGATEASIGAQCRTGRKHKKEERVCRDGKESHGGQSSPTGRAGQGRANEVAEK
ncbi:unnamed protein product [Calypogeia fissa]